MKIAYLFLNLMLVLIIFVNLQAQTQPHFKQRGYWPEDWRGEGSYILDDPLPGTGLVAFTDMESNEPFNCYPFHSGHVKGVSDTVEFVIHFKNFNSTHYDITTLQPEDWFTPVLYEISANPRRSNPIADTSNFDCEFKFWQNAMFERVNKPQSIPTDTGFYDEYYIVYYAWDLPVGRNRLLMKTTASAPSDLTNRIYGSRCHGVWITKPVDLGDTLNAYGACFWRSVDAGDYTGALSWTDSMLTYNQYSIPGYLLKAYAHSDLGDSLAKVTALDSVIAIGERYGDPVVPDSAEIVGYWKLWYEDLLNHAKYYRWKHISGNEKMPNL